MILGFRCSTTDFSYALVDGSLKAPKLIASETIPFPKNYKRPAILNWLKQELHGIAKSHPAKNWAIKGSEPMATRNKAFIERIEHEAIIQLVAAEIGLADVPRRPKQTIAKNLGLPGKAKALVDDLDRNLIPELDGLSDKLQEATLVAWSMLK